MTKLANQIRWHAALVLACLGLAACAETRPSPLTSPGLDSGITASNGGGTRTLGNQVGASVTTSVPSR